MNLFFRRLWLIISTLFVSKQAPLVAPYTRMFRVWLTDQDMFMHMTNSRYLSFSDLGRLNLLIRTGLSGHLKRQHWTLEICGQTRTITRMLKTPQAFEMVCQIEGWTEAYLAIRHQFRRGGKVHAEVNTLMRVIDRSGAPVSTLALLAEAGNEDPSPPLPDIFQDLIGQCDTAQL